MTTLLKDDFLIKRILSSKDNTCITELYNRYSNKIYNRCLSLVKDNSLAQDLTHDIFIKTLFNLSKFKGKSKFSTWLYSITYNHCIDSIKKSKKVNYVEVSEINYTYENYLIEVETKHVFELLEMLKAKEKMILLMKYKDGLSIKEIQKQLNASESAVKMRIARAKEKVRELYKHKKITMDK